MKLSMKILLGLVGGGAAWNPLSLSPSVAYESDDGLYLDTSKTTPAVLDNALVQAWADKTANVRDVLQGTAGKIPLLKLSVINGNPALRFDLGDDFLESVAFAAPLAQPNMVFIVMKHLTGAVTGDAIILDSKATGASREVFQIKNGTPDAWSIWAGTTLTSTDAIDTSVHVFTILYNGASSYIRKDGTQIAAGNAGTNAMGSISLGYGGAIGINSDIAACYVFDTPLSDADRTLMESYLTGKYINP